MALGKAAILFIFLAMFAFTTVGMYSMMQKDAPTDSYYSMTNHTATGSVALEKILQGQSASLMVPVLAIGGIMLLFAGFTILRKA
jgi:hypothetical protein